ncbi:hypothetical protein GCM10017044_19080 [Kordiimonas sediminis]|uniref:DUF429 domain-containing protein n=1 Tax=Kordiimonas sediminis TaxID=1735581 RepID=A0A919E8E4_9PROT|nr:hypothetical protein [Kordiimonas sediminis]GHF24595.1 hypothetical protein GCM10017044_19080 [Kordiimonas sediminis]
MNDFTHFIGIDWSGARGRRHPGIRIAVCAAGAGAPRLVMPPSGMKNWSRTEVQHWIADGMGLTDSDRALVGIDSAFALPHADKGLYFPDFANDPDAIFMWDYIDDHCGTDDDLYGGGFVDAYREHFHLSGGGKGVHYERRLRVTEQISITRKDGPCESVYHLIGPSQVGLSALSTMRMLAFLHFQDDIAVWPFVEPEDERCVLVEIYAARFAGLAGHRGKVRDGETLDTLLAALGSHKTGITGGIADHVSDAMLTAAGLRAIAATQKYWHPDGLSDRVRETEGWIFGIE